MQVSDDPRVGTELAGYRIDSLLGWGGMSVVYLAEDLRLKRRVALKLLAAGLAEGESFRDRFLRESELAASIDHPNIVPIYEAGTTEDLLFIAMRYVEGRDLKERLERGRLDPADAIGLLAQAPAAEPTCTSRDGMSTEPSRSPRTSAASSTAPPRRRARSRTAGSCTSRAPGPEASPPTRRRKDGRELFFYSNRPGTLGGNDIYSATRNGNGPWSTPVNLGPNVNSAASETRPSLSWDGHTLYLGSTRPGGEGMSDIYVTTR